MSAVPSNLSSFIQGLIPGLGGMASTGAPPTFSDGDGFDMWMSDGSQGLPTDFMNFAQMNPYQGNPLMPDPNNARFRPGNVHYFADVNSGQPSPYGPYSPYENAVPLQFIGEAGAIPPHPGFVMPDHNNARFKPSPQDGFNWFASPSAPVSAPQGHQAGGFPGFVGFSPQVNLPFPIQQGPYQTQPLPQASGPNWGGPQPILMNQFTTDGVNTSWGQTMPDGYYQFTPASNGNNVTVMRSEGYDDPNPYNYAYHPYFSGWATSSPYASNSSQNPYYQG